MLLIFAGVKIVGSASWNARERMPKERSENFEMLRPNGAIYSDSAVGSDGSSTRSDSGSFLDSLFWRDCFGVRDSRF